MKIYLGTDHAGFELKEKIKTFLKGLGYTVEDQGAFQLEPEDDYPDYIQVVAKMVQGDPEGSRGIIFGATGEGEAICANRLSGVRAVVIYGYNPEIVQLSRLHNNANILSIGAKFIDPEIAKELVRMWLSTEFSGEERHIRRLKKIDGEIKKENIF